MKRNITGNYYFKPTMLGIIAIIEAVYHYDDNSDFTKFEKATMSDLFELGLVKSPKVLNEVNNDQTR